MRQHRSGRSAQEALHAVRVRKLQVITRPLVCPPRIVYLGKAVVVKRAIFFPIRRFVRVLRHFGINRRSKRRRFRRRFFFRRRAAFHSRRAACHRKRQHCSKSCCREFFQTHCITPPAALSKRREKWEARFPDRRSCTQRVGSKGRCAGRAPHFPLSHPPPSPRQLSCPLRRPE